MSRCTKRLRFIVQYLANKVVPFVVCHFMVAHLTDFAAFEALFEVGVEETPRGGQSRIVAKANMQKG